MCFTNYNRNIVKGKTLISSIIQYPLIKGNSPNPRLVKGYPNTGCIRCWSHRQDMSPVLARAGLICKTIFQFKMPFCLNTWCYEHLLIEFHKTFFLSNCLQEVEQNMKCRQGLSQDPACLLDRQFPGTLLFGQAKISMEKNLQSWVFWG